MNFETWFEENIFERAHGLQKQAAQKAWEAGRKELEQKLAEAEKTIGKLNKTIERYDNLVEDFKKSENWQLKQALSEAHKVIDEIKQLEIYDFNQMEKYQTKIRNLIGLFLKKHGMEKV